MIEPFSNGGIPPNRNVVVAGCEQLPVREARAGSSAAWDVLFKRYQLPLYVYVFELAREEQTSLDIVQETFISAVEHIGTLHDDEKVGSWLFGIAHQKCIQRWRARKRQLKVLDEVEASAIDFEEDPLELLIRNEQKRKFMNALNHLQPAHRSVLLLHFIEEFSLEEIAEITATQLGTVKSRMHYAKKALRKLMEGYENAT